MGSWCGQAPASTDLTAPFFLSVICCCSAAAALLLHFNSSFWGHAHFCCDWLELVSCHHNTLSLSLQLIQFLLSLVQSNGLLGLKRKMQVLLRQQNVPSSTPTELTPPLSSPHSPLMLNDSSSAHSMPKYSRPFSLEVRGLDLHHCC